MLSAVNVFAPSLPWVSAGGDSFNAYRAFAGSDGVAILLPRLVGAAVVIPAAVFVLVVARSSRRGAWTVAAMGLAGQIVLSLQGVAAGRRLTASVGAFGSLQIGWYADLAVVVLGAVAIALGALALVLLARNSAARRSGSFRSLAAAASVGLGAGVVGLLSSDVLFVSRLPWAELSPPPSAAVLVASWTTIAIGVAAPALSAAVSRDRPLATGLVCGWWTFLAVPWTEAVVMRSGLPGNPTPWGFWLGTALALLGGAVLIRRTLDPAPRTRSRTAPPSSSSSSSSSSSTHDWLPRVDENPLRR